LLKTLAQLLADCENAGKSADFWFFDKFDGQAVVPDVAPAALDVDSDRQLALRFHRQLTAPRTSS
jgi:hypothetical protein